MYTHATSFFKKYTSILKVEAHGIKSLRCAYVNTFFSKMCLRFWWWKYGKPWYWL